MSDSENSKFDKDDIMQLVKDTKKRLGMEKTTEKNRALALAGLQNYINKIKQQDPQKISAQVDSYLKFKKQKKKPN